MPTATKFRTVSEPIFRREYGDACDSLEEEDIPQTLPRTYGEVKVPGHGWYPCVLNDKGVPSYFYDEDDGWQPVPSASTFTKV